MAWLPHPAQLIGIAGLLMSIAATIHVLLKKENELSAIAWLGIVWLVPFLGCFLYWSFGINRVRRRARLLRQGRKDGDQNPSEANNSFLSDAGPVALDIPAELPARWYGLHRLIASVTGMPLRGGHQCQVLINGDETYPAMLTAIEQAQHSVALATFIFGNDSWGQRFVAALNAARERGVAVRVLVDGMGRYYSWPTIGKALEQYEIPHAWFLHSLLPWRMGYVNLRNHRKLLIIDGELGFTGGLNIRGHHVGSPPRSKDLHFCLRGPVVDSMARVFAEDWYYTTGEGLEGSEWQRPSSASTTESTMPPQAADNDTGNALVRGIPDGPDENYDHFRWALLAALGEAQQRLFILSPYFLPDRGLQDALKHAAMRGVEVNILLPEKNNWPFMRWAANVVLPGLIEAGCRVFLTPPPFDHTKLMLVDHHWLLVGSGNWDPRSFRLNFEFNVEIYDVTLALRLAQHCEGLMERAQRLSLAQLNARSFGEKLRDSLVHLWSPYL